MTDATDMAVVTGRRWPFAAVAAGVYLLVTLAMFGDVLARGNRAVLSEYGLDMATFNLPMRGYGFAAVRAGRLPLWNPHVYAGTPFAANVQAALFYPPNWLHLVLSDAMAINVGIAAHFFLAAWLMALWAHARTRSMPASLLAGAAFACCGAYFLHIYPGHVTMLHAGAWVPGVFLCIDHIMGWGGVAAVTGMRRLRWAVGLAGMAAMAILAGHPQTVYYTAVAAAVYALAHADQWRGRAGGFVALAAAGIGSAGVAAVQLLPAWALAGASTRAGGLTAETMRQFPMPAENVVSVALPHLFGGPGGDYVGRWSLVESSIFIGAVATVLAAYAAVAVPRTRRLLAVAGVLILLAGVEPSIQDLAREMLPGYGTFRVAGRFALLVDVMLAMTAAEGLAALVARVRPGKGMVIGSAVGAVVLLGTAGWLAASPDVWRELLRAIENGGESLLPHAKFRDAAFVQASHHTAWVQLLTGGGIVGTVAILLGLWRWQGGERAGRWAAAIAVLSMAEVFWVARADRADGPAGGGYPGAWAAAVREARAASPDGGRVATLPLEWANAGVRFGFDDAMGYDPTSLARYAKYLAVSQGVDWRKLDFVPTVRRASQLLDALRVREVLYLDGGGAKAERVETAFPRFVWVHEYEQLAGEDEVMARLAVGVDLRRTVLLETKPAVGPAAGADGTVRVVRERPEEIEVEATTGVPAILLMTDVYAPGWGVRSASGRYELMPADGTLRAIPLAAGTHHFSIVYVAPGLKAGAWISGVSVVMLVGAWVVSRRGGAHG